jgi:hypothetical protein
LAPLAPALGPWGHNVFDDTSFQRFLVAALLAKLERTTAGCIPVITQIIAMQYPWIQSVNPKSMVSCDNSADMSQRFRTLLVFTPPFSE